MNCQFEPVPAASATYGCAVISAPDTLDLQEAARKLGVHYQTVYRWVRTGQLHAQLVNGRYVVDRDALTRADEARRAPSPPKQPSTRRVERQAERMLAALRSGDEAEAFNIARTLTRQGTAIIDLIQQVFAPSLRQIGQEWHDGLLSISVEHRASAIVERLLGELAPNPRGRRRGTAIVVALEGDRHSLPTAMAAVALREDQWRVHHLGADLPAIEIIHFCDEHDIDLAVLTNTTLEVQPLVTSTAAALRAKGVPTIVGGPGRTLDDLCIEARAALTDAAGEPVEARG